MKYRKIGMMEKKEKKNLERKNIEIDKYASRCACESESENENDFCFNLHSFPYLPVFGVCIVSALDVFIFDIFPFEIFLFFLFPSIRKIT